VTQIEVSEDDCEALYRLTNYTDAEVCSVDRRSINRFEKCIADATNSVKDFRFLLNTGEDDGPDSMTVAVPRQLIHGFRVAVDRVVESADIRSGTTDDLSEESSHPEWLEQLRNRAHMWDPTHQADINAGLARYE
jgi:hypothetical protein